ncbi:MAG: radical SAM protein [Deltaproteobacteria bacterium]|nr:radical SAM protein [Deltaproteobacteria bacterium]
MTGNSAPGGGTVDSHHLTKGLMRLTMACNERCRFCNVPVTEGPATALAAAEATAALHSFAASGERTLTISGGEPTLLRGRLVDLVRGARNRGIPFVELQTNAVLVDAGFAAELGAAGLTSAFVALLSHDATIHDDLVGRAGAHAECLSGIDAFVKAGIQVTLNPVITHSMQSLVDEYVAYVATRYPAVPAISLSVVQPHGRAAAELDLLPDYGVLADSVRAAQKRAEQADIELLNPYCGLPICAGWEGATERCVEAIEAVAARQTGDPTTVGLDNRGNKRHGEPCRGCALRPRCGGAWHAYWDHRGGCGLAPPVRRFEPWDPRAQAAPGQTIVSAESEEGEEGEEGELTAAVLHRLAQATTPTVWLVIETLTRGDGQRIAAAGCTDLAWTSHPQQWTEGSDTLRELRRIVRRNETLLPQLELHTTVGLAPGDSFSQSYQALQLAAAVGVDALRLLAPATDRWTRFLAAARSEHPGLDVALVEEPEP